MRYALCGDFNANLVSQEGPVPVVQKLSWDLLLVGTQLTAHDGPVDPILVLPTKPPFHLQLGLPPADRVRMPRHSTFPGPPCTWCKVLDHPKVPTASKSLPKLPLESRDIHGRCITLRATCDMGQSATGNEMQTFMVMRAPSSFFVAESPVAIKSNAVVAISQGNESGPRQRDRRDLGQ
jgi:hypothetical protein